MRFSPLNGAELLAQIHLLLIPQMYSHTSLLITRIDCNRMMLHFVLLLSFSSRMNFKNVFPAWNIIFKQIPWNQTAWKIVAVSKINFEKRVNILARQKIWQQMRCKGKRFYFVSWWLRLRMIYSLKGIFVIRNMFIM